MSYLTLAEAAQYVQQETGMTIDATALLRAGALGYLIIVAAFSGSMRNLTTHRDDDVLGLLVIPPMHLLEIEIDGEASIKGAFSLDGKIAYSPQVTRTREQLSVLVSELDRVIPYVTEPKAAPPRAYQLGIARQKESPDGIIGWWDYTMDADFWWKQPTVSPQEAALLLCQLNPHDNDLAPESSQNGETGPQEYKKLLRTFEGVQSVQQERRTLDQWLLIAKSDGLKYHSWVDDYQSAVDARRRQSCGNEQQIHSELWTAGESSEKEDQRAEWIVRSIALAHEIGLRKWNNGEREITARNIAEAVATELAKGEPGEPQKYHGSRGPRASGTIRNQALGGWKFKYPSGTSGTNGTD